jgi:PKD repeat protein
VRMPRARGLLCLLSLAVGNLVPTPVLAATLNVTAYGANGADSNGDLAAFQNAVSAAAAGDTVYVPSGTYYLPSTLALKSGIRLVGEGAAATVLRYTGASPGAMLYLNQLTNVELAHLTLEGNANVEQGVLANGGGGHSIHHVAIKNLTRGQSFGPFGIYFVGAPDSRIIDNVISNIGVGSSWGGGVRVAWGSHRVEVSRNTISETGRGGIFGNDGCTDLVVRGNTVSGSGRTAEGLGIELHTGCDRSLIEDNTVDHWISAVNSQYIAVRRNVVRAKDGTHKLAGLELMNENTVATDNLVDDGQQIGISVSPATGHQYWGYNTITGMIMWGAQLTGNSTDSTQYQYFYKNRFLQTKKGDARAWYPGSDGHGFRIHGTTRNVTLDGNEFHANGRLGIEFTGGAGVDLISFINNTITHNAGASINQYPSSAANLEWANNTVSGNGTNTQLTSRGFGNRKPTAAFVAPATVQPGQAVTFTNQSSDPDGTIAHSLWDFGHGIPSSATSPTYTYTTPGTYRVTLVVWDNGGRAALREQTVTVSTAPAPLPAPWQHQDIGTVGVVGDASHAGGVFTVKGSGTDIFGTADQFHYVYQPMNGDGQIIARVSSIQNTNGNAKAGVMIRESLATGARHALVDITPGAETQFIRRATTNGASAYTLGASRSAPHWVRLERIGNQFNAYESANGSTWTLIGSDTLILGSTVHVGLAVLSKNNAVLNTSTFDNVRVTP